jgi:hypothetical protein
MSSQSPSDYVEPSEYTSDSQDQNLLTGTTPERGDNLLVPLECNR